MRVVLQEEIVKFYNKELKKKRKYSNCYISVLNMEKECLKGKISAFEGEESFLIFHEQERYVSLYFLCDTWGWLEQLEELKARNDYHSIMIDIVKKGDLGDYNIFCKKGMPLVKTYNRLRLMSPPKEIDCSVPIEYCKENDFLRLREMMDSTFEVVGDNIPSDSELLDLIRQESIICSRIEHEVVGFIIFEDKGKTSYIRMVCIDENHRGEKLGYRLMTMYFLIHLEFCGFTLWYKSDNVPAFSLYSKWGYKDEDMHDYIFLI